MKRILLLTTVFMMMLGTSFFILHRQMRITFIKVIW